MVGPHRSATNYLLWASRKRKRSKEVFRRWWCLARRETGNLWCKSTISASMVVLREPLSLAMKSMTSNRIWPQHSPTMRISNRQLCKKDKHHQPQKGKRTEISLKSRTRDKRLIKQTLALGLYHREMPKRCVHRDLKDRWSPKRPQPRLLKSNQSTSQHPFLNKTITKIQLRICIKRAARSLSLSSNLLRLSRVVNIRIWSRRPVRQTKEMQMLLSNSF